MREKVLLLQLIPLAHPTISARCRVGRIYSYRYIYMYISGHVGEAAYNGNANTIKLPPTRL